MITLSVVIPAYNEEKGIAEIIRRVSGVQNELMKIGVSLSELLVVDDGSSDQTSQIIHQIEAEDDCVHLIRHPKNRGYGAALKTGFSKSSGDLIGFLDADGTYPPENFPELCSAVLKGNELVIGSRMAGAESMMPVTRRIGNFLFAGLLSILSKKHITDSASGMRVFKREVLRSVYPLPNGLNLTPVMSARAIHEGVDIVEVPIPYSERVGRSKLSVIRDGSIFLHSIIWTILAYNPVSVLGTLGLTGMAIAGLITIALIAARLSGITTIGAWGVAALYTGMVTGLTGISLFSLGITFNYLVSLFFKRPVRRGLFGTPIFTPSIDHQFGWIGLLTFLGGAGLALASIILGIRGWEVSRIWLYMLGSAMLTLIGVNLMVNWVILRVLDELSQREFLADKDLNLS